MKERDQREHRHDDRPTSPSADAADGRERTVPNPLAHAMSGDERVVVPCPEPPRIQELGRGVRADQELVELGKLFAQVTEGDALALRVTLLGRCSCHSGYVLVTFLTAFATASAR